MTVAVITGASRREGIGFEVARQLARRGMFVVVTARKREVAEARAIELAAEGLEVEGFELDVTDEDGIARITRHLETRHGRVDVLVNNAAGVAASGEQPLSTDLREAHATLEATLFGAWRVTRALFPLLARSDHPRIVNVSSGAGSHGDQAFGLATANAMGAAYAVSKAALNALTVLLAKELRGRVLVNAVCPGFTATFAGAEAMGARPVAEGAASVVWAATLPDDGPTGGLFRDGEPLPW